MCDEERGFVSLDRKMLNWEWWKDTNTAHLFVHMIIKAEWSDIKYRGETIKRGSFVATLAELSVETGMSVRNIRTALKHLKLTNDVTIQTNHQYSVFTVVNYNKYQDPNRRKTPQVTNDRQTSDKRVTNDRQTSDKPSYINNNTTIKQYNNITNNNPPLPPLGESPKYDFGKHTNVENLNHVLTEKLSDKAEEILGDEMLKDLIVEWMEYKDERKPKSSNHYTEKGICKLLTMIVGNYSKFGYDEMRRVVDGTISSNYSGIVWDWLLKNQKTNSKSYTQAIRDRVSEVDSWV